MLAERFAYIESAARAQGRSLDQLTLDEMEQLWQQGKKAQSDKDRL